jgi:ribonuclease HI
MGGKNPSTTNNRMEMVAILRALQNVREIRGPLEVVTDSLYVLRGITQWVFGWKKRDWKTAEGKDVLNADLWQALLFEVGHRRNHQDTSIRWSYVKGHSGIPGNERTDEIAVAFSQSKAVPHGLYHGPLLRYFVAVHDLPELREIPEVDPESWKNRKNTDKPIAYLSLVNGVAETHADWKSCEARVKGRPGAKFKKAMSVSEAATIWKEWGVTKPTVLPESQYFAESSFESLSATLLNSAGPRERASERKIPSGMYQGLLNSPEIVNFIWS